MAKNRIIAVILAPIKTATPSFIFHCIQREKESAPKIAATPYTLFRMIIGSSAESISRRSPPPIPVKTPTKVHRKRLF